MGLGFVVGVFGVAILAHAAYSTIQFRGLLKIMEEEFSNPPMNVVVELLLGLVLCMWAALTVPGKFLSIHPDSEDNRMVSLPGNLEFMIFNHRGKVFPSEAYYIYGILNIVCGLAIITIIWIQFADGRP